VLRSSLNPASAKIIPPSLMGHSADDWRRLKCFAAGPLAAMRLDFVAVAEDHGLRPLTSASA
jgi:hypothetical protein